MPTICFAPCGVVPTTPKAEMKSAEHQQEQTTCVVEPTKQYKDSQDRRQEPGAVQCEPRLEEQKTFEAASTASASRYWMMNSFESSRDDETQAFGHIDHAEGAVAVTSDHLVRLEKRICAQLAYHERRIINEINTWKEAGAQTPRIVPQNGGAPRQLEPIKRLDTGNDSGSSLGGNNLSRPASKIPKERRTSRLNNFLREFRIKRAPTGGSSVISNLGNNALNRGKTTLTTHSVEVRNVQRWSLQIEGDGLHEDHAWKLVTCARALLKKRWFDYLVALLIVLNSLAIAADADWTVRNPSSPSLEVFHAADLSVTILFTIELFLRVVAEGRRFVSRENRHLKWNILDSFLVTSAIADEICKLLLDAIVDMSFIRVVRFFRLVRVVRIVRVVRFLKDLRTMIASVVRSIKSLASALLLLLMLAFTFATFILEFVAGELQAADAVVDGERIAILEFHFGSLVMTIFTLFKAITNGVDWGEPAHALIKISPFLGFMFAMYVAFATMCVMNIIVGIFVENSSMSAMKDEHTLLLESLDEKKRWQDEVIRLFNELGGDESIAYNEFEERIGDLNVQAKMRKLGLDIEPHAMLGLFDILDYDRSGSLSKEEFVLGLRMLHGSAKSIDIARLLHDNGRIRHELKELRESLGSHSEC